MKKQYANALATVVVLAAALTINALAQSNDNLGTGGGGGGGGEGPGCPSYNPTFSGTNPHGIGGSQDHETGGHGYTSNYAWSCEYSLGQRIGSDPDEWACQVTAVGVWSAVVTSETGDLDGGCCYDHYPSEGNMVWPGAVDGPTSTVYATEGFAVEGCGVDPTCSATTFTFPGGGQQPNFVYHPGFTGTNWQNYGTQDNHICPYETTENPSPIYVDLKCQSFQGAFTSVEDGVKWDFYGSGKPVQISWSNPDRQIAWLVLPDNGKVWSVQQMFGNLTNQPLTPKEMEEYQSEMAAAGKPIPFRPNGFRALAKWDSNGDGIIDARDQAWPKFRLWIDSSHTGDYSKGTVLTLDQAGIKSISLHYVANPTKDKFDNQMRYSAPVSWVDPSRSACVAADVYLHAH